MTGRTSIGVIMNGVTGRMGYNQHLVRSLLAIREQGGLELADGTTVSVDPVIVGRNASKLAAIADRHGIARWSTDLDEVLADSTLPVYFDAQLTHLRHKSLIKAMDAGKHVYTEKPIADSVDNAVELAEVAARNGVKNGVVHDKLYLPGLLKLKSLIDGGFFGRILSVRGEFGYWVFEGDWQQAQRPSWNYRAEDGGGITVDMFCHWSYVLENLFGQIRAVTAKAVTHIPTRWDEQRHQYPATADDAAYAIFEIDGGVIAQLNSSWCVRVHRAELLELQVDGTLGSAVAGLHRCSVQPRAVTPRPVWNPDLVESHDFRSDWHEVPDNEPAGNGFKVQWEQFLRHVVEDGPHPYDFRAGARGVQLAVAGLQSSDEGRRIQIQGDQS